jgi:hypothetical protein
VVRHHHSEQQDELSGQGRADGILCQTRCYVRPRAVTRQDERHQIAVAPQSDSLASRGRTGVNPYKRSDPKSGHFWSFSGIDGAQNRSNSGIRDRTWAQNGHFRAIRHHTS